MALLGFLFSCKTQLNTVKPDETYITPVIENKPSTIAMSIDIDVPELEKSINNSMKGTLYDDNNIVDDNVMVKVLKQQDFHFTVVGNTISCSLPLKVWVKYRYKNSILGVSVNSDYEATGALTIEVSSMFNLSKDWKISTVTNIGKYVWTEAPKINAIGLQIPVTFVADMAIKSLKGKISSSIDKAITENIKLRNIMEDTWNMVQNPINLDKNYNVWLKVNPLAFYSTPINGSGNKIHFNLGLKTIVETRIGTAIDAPVTKTKLPEYQISNDIKPHFELNTDITVSYEKITELAQQYVVGKTFTQGRKQVKITKINLFGKGEKVVVVIDVEGSANGTIYCEGTVAYDSTQQALRIKDFDFEVKTRNALVKSANWLLHNNFLKMIEPMLTIPVKEQIQTAITSGNTFLQGYHVRKGVSLQGNLHHIVLNKIAISSQAIILGGSISGSLKIEIGDLL